MQVFSDLVVTTVHSPLLPDLLSHPVPPDRTLMTVAGRNVLCK